MEAPLFGQDETSGKTVIGLRECRRCGHRAFPPVLLGCERCGAPGDDLDAVTVAARGRVLAAVAVFTGEDESITVGSVRLDDGPVVRVALDTPLDTGDEVAGVIVTGENAPALIFRKAT